MQYIIVLYSILMYPFLSKISNKKFIIFCGIIPMFLSLGFQTAIGTDYYSYIRIFNNEVAFEYSRGPLFKILVSFLKETFNNERTMFVSVAAIQMFVYYKIINVLYFRKYIDNIPLFIYLSLVTSNFYLSMFNALRSSIASLFIFLSILILLENKKLKSFLLILAGACFHPSVIIWTPIIFIRKIFYKKMKLRFLIFIILCFVLNHLNFIPNTAKFIYDTGIDIPYRNYLISYHMFPYTKTLGIATIINMLIFIFSLFAIYEKEYDKNKIYIYNLGYISFSLLLLFANIPIFTRLLEPSVLFRNYIIYKLIKKTCRKKYLYLGIFFILYFFMTFVRMSLGQIAAS